MFVLCDVATDLLHIIGTNFRLLHIQLHLTTVLTERQEQSMETFQHSNSRILDSIGKKTTFTLFSSSRCQLIKIFVPEVQVRCIGEINNIYDKIKNQIKNHESHLTVDTIVKHRMSSEFCATCIRNISATCRYNCNLTRYVVVSKDTEKNILALETGRGVG